MGADIQADDAGGAGAGGGDRLRPGRAFTPQLGTKVILVPIVGVEGQDDATGVERWIEGLRACAPTAEESGAILALENVGRSPAKSAPAIAALLEAVNSPAVRAYYDVGNGTSLGYDPIAELKLLGGADRPGAHQGGPLGAAVGEHPGHDAPSPAP